MLESSANTISFAMTLDTLVREVRCDAFAFKHHVSRLRVAVYVAQWQMGLSDSKCQFVPSGSALSHIFSDSLRSQSFEFEFLSWLATRFRCPSFAGAIISSP